VFDFTLRVFVTVCRTAGMADLKVTIYGVVCCYDRILVDVAVYVITG